MGDLAFHAVKVRLTDPGGQAEDGGLQQAAHTVAVSPSGADGSLHGLLHGGVQHGKALRFVGQGFHLCGQRSGIVQRKAGVGDARTGGDMGGDVDTSPAQRTQHDGTAGHEGGGDPAGKVPAAPCILKPVVLGIGGVIGVAGAQQVGGLGVIGAAGVLVFHHQRNGGAGGAAVHYAGQKLHGVCLGAGSGQAVAPGAAFVHAGGHKGFVHRDPGGHAVQHGADGPSVALAENGQRKIAAKGVFHGVSPPCPAGDAAPPRGWSRPASSPDPAP